MKSYFNQLTSIILVVASLVLVACGQPKEPKKGPVLHEYRVQERLIHKSLHFSGTVQPLHESTLSSPIEAVVEGMDFHYGQMVQKGDVIVTLNSTELQRQFNDSLTEYLKAKDNYSIAKAKFVGTQDLWDAGLLSKNTYLNEKSNMNTSRVTLMQASHKLTEMLAKLDENHSRNLSSLSLADFDKLKSILLESHNLIHLRAANNGVLLYPPKAGEDKSARVMVGASVKPGQVIGLIGDLSGIRIEIDVPEIDIPQVQVGMEATVSGVAFGKYQLKGSLVAVNAQASSTNGLPFFTAVVEVRKLSAEQQKWIKVGMSAAIELRVDNGKQLVIPIAAIQREKGQNRVRVKNAAGAIESRVITTGAAQADSVQVESGLTAGEVVVYE